MVNVPLYKIYLSITGTATNSERLGMYRGKLSSSSTRAAWLDVESLSLHFVKSMNPACAGLTFDLHRFLIGGAAVFARACSCALYEYACVALVLQICFIFHGSLIGLLAAHLHLLFWQPGFQLSSYQ